MVKNLNEGLGGFVLDVATGPSRLFTNALVGTAKGVYRGGKYLYRKANPKVEYHVYDHQKNHIQTFSDSPSAREFADQHSLKTKKPAFMNITRGGEPLKAAPGFFETNARKKTFRYHEPIVMEGWKTQAGIVGGALAGGFAGVGAGPGGVVVGTISGGTIGGLVGNAIEDIPKGEHIKKTLKNNGWNENPLGVFTHNKKPGHRITTGSSFFDHEAHGAWAGSGNHTDIEPYLKNDLKHINEMIHNPSKLDKEIEHHEREISKPMLLHPDANQKRLDYHNKELRRLKELRGDNDPKPKHRPNMLMKEERNQMNKEYKVERHMIVGGNDDIQITEHSSWESIDQANKIALAENKKLKEHSLASYKSGRIKYVVSEGFDSGPTATSIGGDRQKKLMKKATKKQVDESSWDKLGPVRPGDPGYLGHETPVPHHGTGGPMHIDPARKLRDAVRKKHGPIHDYAKRLKPLKIGDDTPHQ